MKKSEIGMCIMATGVATAISAYGFLLWTFNEYVSTIMSIGGSVLTIFGTIMWAIYTAREEEEDENKIT